MDALFPGFAARRIRTAGTEIHCVVGGAGPPLLLLHGYPQTHAMWHRVAPALAREFTVVCADLRGYGDSGKPASDATHAAYSKRAMAQDMVEVMRELGFARFRLAGHDRGGRVAHRLCLDHPDAVERVAVLDISPTRTMFAETDQAFATAYYHWFFLIQPFDMPEKLIGADPTFYLHWMMGRLGLGLEHFDARALAEYERCFADAGHHPCDVRGLSRRGVDRPRARRRGCRCRSARSSVHCWRCGARRASSTVCSRRCATGARSRRMSAARRCRRGTICAEEVPEETLRELRAFFG